MYKFYNLEEINLHLCLFVFLLLIYYLFLLLYGFSVYRDQGLILK